MLNHHVFTRELFITWMKNKRFEKRVSALEDTNHKPKAGFKFLK